jgi:membrane associated rhomboid family serine protease
MGIHDRDYARNDGRSVFDGFTARTQVCIVLVVVNLFVYFVQLATREQFRIGYGPGWFTDLFILDTSKVLHGEVWRLFTHAFLHDYGPDGLTHILINLLFLWWGGSHLEDVNGGREFLVFYFLSILAAGLGFLLFQVIRGEPARALGASGAVCSIMVAFAWQNPTRIVYLFLLLPVPIWAFVAFQVTNDALGLVSGSPKPIAFAAHLSGALFGFLYGYFGWRLSTWLPSFSRGGGRRNVARPAGKPVKLFTEIVPDEDDEPATTTAPVAPAVSASRASGTTDRSKVDEHLEAKLDEVLEKVTKFGQSSLTESEREILLKASEIYRKRKER